MDFDILSTKIQENNKNGEYKQSILSLYEIIYSPKATYRDKSNAYFLKAKMLRQLGIYPEAIANMELAYEKAVKTKETQNLDKVFLFEIAMIHCEQAKYDKAVELFNQVDANASNLPVDSRANAIWLYLKGIVASESNEHEKAIEYLNQAIGIFEKAEPMYLVVAYKELLRNYIALGQSEQILKTYDKTIELATFYHWKSEILQTHRIMAVYYTDIGEYEKSSALSKVVLTKATAFNTVNISSNLNLLEKQLLQAQAQVQRTKEIRLLVFALVALIGIVIMVYFLLKGKRKNTANKNYLVEKNIALKTTLDQLKQKNIQDSITPTKLSVRQKSIIDLVKKGKTNKEIAQKLNISENTVKYHLKTIYGILGIKNRREI
ncbi:tetratricopeptide repeat protein [Myroides sp. LJL116]